MKILNAAIFSALATIAYSKVGSEAKEPNQLIGKAGDDDQLELKNALVCILYIVSEKCIGGGALLSSQTVIVPMIIFSEYYGTSVLNSLNFRVVIGLDSFLDPPFNSFHFIYNIKHNIGPTCGIEEALGIIVIEPLSEDETTDSSSVPHIPLATQSYTLGEDFVSEFIVVLNKDSELGKYPICNILVDEEGKISAHIPTDYEEMFSEYDPIYHGGFITRGGTLAGLAFKLQRKEHSKQPDRLYFLTVDGNHPLIRNSGDKDIQIIDIDSSQSSNYAKRNDEGSSNTAYS